MKIYLRIILSAFIAMIPWLSEAQSIKTDFDKKIILVDSLNLPKNTSLQTLLSYLPELLQRPGDYILSNYDVQIDGMSIGSTTDAALSELQVIDIERIEVSESPMKSYNNNGQGGTIDIIPRTDKEKNLWGTAGASTSNPLDFSPKVNIAYRKGRLMVRGIILAEVYNNDHFSEQSTFNNGSFVQLDRTENKENFRTHMARAYIRYALSEKDNIKLNVSENYLYDKTSHITNHDESLSNEIKNTGSNMRAQLTFEHKGKKSLFTSETQFAYNPGCMNYNALDGGHHSDTRTRSVSGKIEYEQALLSGDSKNLKLTLGTTYNNTFLTETVGTSNTISVNAQDIEAKHKSRMYHLMPYICFEGGFGKLRVKAVAEYQYLKKDIDRIAKPYSDVTSDFTGQLMGEWHFDAHNNLRLIVDRKLQRPSDEQIYPYVMFSTERMGYVQGNPELLPMMSHEVKLDYIADRKWNNANSMLFNVGMSYNHLSDIVGEKLPQQPDTQSGLLGSTLQYVSFANEGKCDIASANLMTIYSYKAFSLAATGNIYHKMEDEKDHYTYYNVSVHPYFNLKDGWHGGMKLTYYSKVDQTDGYLGDCATTSISIGKAWKSLFVYVSENVTIQKSVRDVTFSGNQRIEKSYELTPNSVTAGIKYIF